MCSGSQIRCRCICSFLMHCMEQPWPFHGYLAFRGVDWELHNFWMKYSYGTNYGTQKNVHRDPTTLELILSVKYSVRFSVLFCTWKLVTHFWLGGFMHQRWPSHWRKFTRYCYRQAKLQERDLAGDGECHTEPRQNDTKYGQQHSNKMNREEVRFVLLHIVGKVVSGWKRRMSTKSNANTISQSVLLVQSGCTGMEKAQGAKMLQHPFREAPCDPKWRWMLVRRQGVVLQQQKQCT